MIWAYIRERILPLFDIFRQLLVAPFFLVSYDYYQWKFEKNKKMQQAMGSWPPIYDKQPEFKHPLEPIHTAVRIFWLLIVGFTAVIALAAFFVNLTGAKLE